eukprot:8221513-Ditylum_brightwellii.AAC.2
MPLSLDSKLEKLETVLEDAKKEASNTLELSSQSHKEADIPVALTMYVDKGEEEKRAGNGLLEGRRYTIYTQFDFTT